jgi:DNA-binding transcriptional MerR regulator
METRVLTLFDDEDFFPQEETPKNTGKKTTAAKEEPVETNEPVATQPLFTEEPVNETDEPTLPIAQENTTTAAAAAAPEADIAITAADVIPALEDRDIAAADTEPAPLPESEAPGETETRVPSQPTQPAEAEDELSKQLLNELIQQDYTAFIHRDYPFDVQQASVVQQDKEVKPAPQARESAIIAHKEEVFEDVVPLPEWKLDKKYYTIGEVAQLFTVNTSHIRFWTNEFNLKPRTTRKGDRLYSPKDIAELRLIHHLVKEKKHTIKGAREKLKVEKVSVNQKLDLKESLTGLRDMLMQIKEQL